MQTKKSNFISISAHGIFWLVAGYALFKSMGTVSVESVTIINGVKSVTKMEEGNLLPISVVWSLSIALFYTNTFFLLPRWIQNRRLGNYALAFMALLLSVLLLDYFLMWSFRSFPLRFEWMPNPRLLAYLLFSGLSFAYFFIAEWVKGEQVKREMREHQLRTELNFLRSQIEPHFLFNSLNNLFYLAQETKHQELINGISSLSNMMRYMLYETNHETVPIKSEVLYLDHYIQLQKLKFATQDQIRFHFEKKGDLENIAIAPMILLPFVENAFKYGINYEAQSFIELSLEGRSDQINFHVINSNHSTIHKLKDDKNGIGLENVKRRLQLIYPQRHSLVIEEKPETFHVRLQIKIH